MENYEQVLEKVELALAKGEYHFCIEYLSPIIESFPLSSKEGDNLRTILITALCGLNRKEEAKKFCKELSKSYKYKTRENAKYLLEIIDSPEIKKPENWNIKLETNSNQKKLTPSSLQQKKINLDEKKFINITDTPTGEIKPFKKGFSLIILVILLLLIPLLSGCVKIENTLDIRDPDSINNSLKVESKYINKFPWQIKFEDRIRDIFPNAEISADESNFYLKNRNLSLRDTKETLKKIQQVASELAGSSTNLEIYISEKNLIFLKKYNYRINFDLQTIPEIDNMEIVFKIIHPNRAIFYGTNNSQTENSKNLIIWNLNPREINSLEFSFWSWNKLLICISLISLILLIAYLLRFYRFKIGTDLPQLPSN